MTRFTRENKIVRTVPLFKQPPPSFLHPPNPVTSSPAEYKINDSPDVSRTPRLHLEKEVTTKTLTAAVADMKTIFLAE
jgi:hypothetical protein